MFHRNESDWRDVDGLRYFERSRMMLVVELWELGQGVEGKRPCEMEGCTSRRFYISLGSSCEHGPVALKSDS